MRTSRSDGKDYGLTGLSGLTESNAYFGDID